MAEPRARQPRGSDRLALLLAFVPWLIEREVATVADAARRFDVSEELVRELVRLIAVSGVPGESRSYLHEDLFDIDWNAFEDEDEIVLTNRVVLQRSPRFSAREAAAVIAGLQYLSAFPDNADRSTIATLFGKLSHSAAADPTPLGVVVGGNRDRIGLIREAIRVDRQLEFDYLNARGEQDSRRADPLRLDSVDDHWYLRAWCHLREAVRTFRLDRIVAIRTVDAPRRHRGEDHLLPDALFQPSPSDLEVELEFSESVLPQLADFLEDAEITPAGAGRRRARIRIAHHHRLKRLVAELPGMVTVVGPPDARAAVRDWAQAGLDGYRTARPDEAPAGGR